MYGIKKKKKKENKSKGTVLDAGMYYNKERMTSNHLPQILLKLFNNTFRKFPKQGQDRVNYKNYTLQ